MLGCATIATCSVPPAELAMVSTRSERALSFLSSDRLRLFVWSVAVVTTKSLLANPVFRGKLGITVRRKYAGIEDHCHLGRWDLPFAIIVFPQCLKMGLPGGCRDAVFSLVRY